MVILVDHDNVEPTHRSGGAMYIAQRVLDAIGMQPFKDGEHVAFRFYGGWYEGQQMTRRAQDLAANISAAFPQPFTLGDSTQRVTLRLVADLAHGLAADPGGVLPDTYRIEKADVRRLRLANQPFGGCKSPQTCGMATALVTVLDDSCPLSQCPVTVAQVVTKPQQKLIDTLMTADLLHYATRGDRSVGIVSSDDDMWPGIRAALIYGARVYHVHTRPGRRTPVHYAHGAGPLYTQQSIG